MSARKKPLFQFKLRIPETLRDEIEKAAKTNQVSANREMANRLWRSFEQGDLLTVTDFVEDFRNIHARYSDAFHKMDRQGDLILAADALVKAIEQLPEISKPIQAALEKTQKVIWMIEREASQLPRRMHTTGAE